MARLPELRDARSRVSLAPELGGAIAAFDALLPGGPTPVLRAWDGAPEPFSLACNVLTPFSNRISGGGFTFEGAFHPVPRNLDGQDFPIHGDGFQRPWEVGAASATELRLRLDTGGIGPFRYAATLDYRLEDGALISELTLTNRGPRLPFGGGFHPWLPRRPGTALSFPATGFWTEDDRHLPRAHLSVRESPEMDFSMTRPLPDGWINTAFTGWTRRACVQQPELGIAVEISSPTLDVAIVYSPGRAADFFCFEPVSHAVDAINQDSFPGLKVLGAGEAITLAMRINWASRKPDRAVAAVATPARPAVESGANTEER